MKSSLEKNFIKFCQKFQKESILESKIDYYDKLINNQYEISSLQIKKASLFILLILIIFSYLFYIFSSISYDFLIFLTISEIIFYYFLINYFRNEIKKKEFSQINKYQILKLQLNLFLINTNKTVDRDVILVELLSKNFSLAINLKKILNQIYMGSDTQDKLCQIHFYSEDFQDFFNKLIEFNYNSNLAQNFDNFNNNYTIKFQTDSKNLDSKLNLFFFISLFFPILFFFLDSYFNFNLFQSSFAIIFFILILYLIVNKSLQNKFNLLGLIDINNSRERNHFYAFLKFFNHLTHYLKTYPPELAIIHSINKLDKKDYEKLNFQEINNNLKFPTLNQFLMEFFNLNNINQIIIFKEIFFTIFKKNSLQGSSFFQKISESISNHLNLFSDQQILLKSSLIKINIYKNVLGIILGIIGPFINKFQFFSYTIQKSIQIENLLIIHEDNLIWVFIFALVMFCAVLYFYDLVVRSSKSMKLNLIALILFILTFFFSNTLLENLFLF